MIETNEANNFLFVTGPSRSGTTLLRLILSAHPKISITPETRFVQQIFRYRWNPETPLSYKQKIWCKKLIREDQLLNNWPDYDIKEILQFITNETEVTIKKILKYLFITYDNDNEIFGNKKGIYSFGYGEYTKQIFPSAQFIFITRDPRDVVRSQLVNFPDSDPINSSINWILKHKKFQALAEKFPNDTKIIKYESLVKKPVEISKNCCRFLGIDFSPSMTSFHQRASDKLISQTKKVHKNTLKPPDPAKIGQWKTYDGFSQKDIDSIEYVTEEIMDKLDYNKTTSKRFLRLKLYYYYKRLRWSLRKISHFKNRLFLKCVFQFYVSGSSL